MALSQIPLMVLMLCLDIRVCNKVYCTAFLVLKACILLSGGLQTLIKHQCGRHIMYIHCFNHRLHLALRTVMEEIIELEDFFHMLSDLHGFFKIPNVAKLYQGLTTKALITTRWSGHFSAVKTIKSSYTQLVDCLANVTTSRTIKPGHPAVGRGLLDFLKKKCTVFLMHFMYDVLQLLDILVQTFQQTSSNVTSAFKTFQSVQKELKNLSEKYTSEYINDLVCDHTNEDENEPSSKRARRITSTLNDNIVTTRLAVFMIKLKAFDV